MVLSRTAVKDEEKEEVMTPGFGRGHCRLLALLGLSILYYIRARLLTGVERMENKLENGGECRLSPRSTS